MSRFVVVNAAGDILRTGYAARPATQGGDGETVYVLENGDGSVIPDDGLKITDGAFEAINGFEGDLPPGSLSEAEPIG